MLCITIMVLLCTCDDPLPTIKGVVSYYVSYGIMTTVVYVQISSEWFFLVYDFLKKKISVYM